MSDNIHNAAPDLVEFLNEQDIEASARAWRDGLKVGDVVVIAGAYSKPFVAKVEHVTPTRIEAKGIKFRRGTSRRVGVVGYDTTKIIQPTEAVLYSIRVEDSVLFLKTMNWYTLSHDVLLDIAARVKAFDAAKVEAADGGEEKTG